MVKTVGIVLLAGLVIGVVREHPWLLVVAALVVLAVVSARSRMQAAGAMRIGHAHGGGTSGFIGRHEAGHVAVARATGFGGITVQADRHGGSVFATRVPKDPVARIATFRAGEFAVGSRAGCSYDREQVKVQLRRVPKGDRARTLAEGEALARRLVRQHRGAIRRDGRTIAETGTL